MTISYFSMFLFLSVAATACAANPGGDDPVEAGPDAGALSGLDAEPAEDAGADTMLHGDARSTAPIAFAPEATLRNDPAPLATPTYDGSGQAVEPTVLEFPNLWHGHRYWMAMSPYPGANDQDENPSILVSPDGLTWTVPDGLQNPLALPPPGGHLDDATIVYDDASDQIWLYYLEDQRVDGSSVNQETLFRMRSSDGVHWMPKESVLTSPGYDYVSPSIVKAGGVFTLWTIVAPQGCFTVRTKVMARTSRDGLSWSRPREVATGLDVIPWHLNTIAAPVPGGFLSVVSAFPHGANCQATELYLALGNDMNWRSENEPLLGRGTGHGWDSSEIYRSSLLYDADASLLRIWYSARPVGSQKWHIGYAQGPMHLVPVSAE